MGIAKDYVEPTSHPTYAVRRHFRYARILDLRAQGESYPKIGKVLGISGTYVSQLHRRAKREFYSLVDVPVYKRPRLEPTPVYEMHVLYHLKDFLTEIADGK